jgi:uncharacterized protein YbjT (DUF2867 family)
VLEVRVHACERERFKGTGRVGAEGVRCALLTARSIPSPSQSSSPRPAPRARVEASGGAVVRLAIARPTTEIPLAPSCRVCGAQLGLSDIPVLSGAELTHAAGFAEPAQLRRTVRARPACVPPARPPVEASRRSREVVAPAARADDATAMSERLQGGGWAGLVVDSAGSEARRSLRGLLQDGQVC